MHDATHTAIRRLAASQRAATDPGAMWDRKSAAYAAAQDADPGRLPDRVVDILDRVVGLSGARILDVGGGSGRYALRFLDRGAQVVLADASAGMIAEAAARAGDRLETRQVDWSGADLDELGWVGGFDLVYASMVATARDADAIERMGRASRGWCAVHQFVRTFDTAIDAVLDALGQADAPDVHRDPEYAAALTDYLWLTGRTPVTDLAEDEETVRQSPEALAVRLSGRFGDAAKSAGVDLREVLASVADADGLVTVRRSVAGAVIAWRP